MRIYHGGNMKIFCDLDGTVIDVATRHYRVYSETTQQFNGLPLSKAQYWDLKRKKMKWSELLPLSGLSSDIENGYLKVFIEKIEDPAYLKFDLPFPGAIDTLASLAEKGQCYLVSLRRNRRNLLDQLKGLAVDKYFTEVLSGHSEHDGYDVKITLIKDRLGDEPGIIIGDTEADIVTGKKLGMTSIAVTSGIRDEAFLRALSPDYLVENIREITELPDM